MFIDSRVAITYTGIKQLRDPPQGGAFQQALQPLQPPTPRILRLAQDGHPGVWAGREVRQVARDYCEEFRQREALRRHVLTGARQALVQEFGSDRALSAALSEHQCTTALRVLFANAESPREELVDGLQQVSALLGRYEQEAQALWEAARQPGSPPQIRGADALYKASFGAIHAALRDEGLLHHALGKGRAIPSGDTIDLEPPVRARAIAQAMRYCEEAMQDQPPGTEPAQWALAPARIEEAVQAALVRQGLLALND